MNNTYRHLTRYDRHVIYKLKRSFHPVKKIAEITGFHVSTIYREIKRNKWPDYKTHTAHDIAKRRRYRSNQARRKLYAEHKTFVAEHLAIRWSPEQIASRFPSVFGFTITPRTLYRYVHSYDGYLMGLRRHLRIRGKMRRSNWRYNRSINPTPLPRINDRPEDINSRADFGHWEMDLMEGPKQQGKSMLVLIERKSRYSLARFVSDQKAKTIRDAAKRALKPFYVKSITTDNGSEFLEYEKLKEALGAPVYYCNPYRSWEKGAVENVIGLYRDYFPKKSLLPDSQIHATIAQTLLNDRPKKVLDFLTPHSFLKQILNQPLS
jgi:transposase, IS30 family